MIVSVAYTSAAPSTSVAITMADGRVWHTDASLPPDTDIRRQLAEWITAGGEIAPFDVPDAAEPVPSLTARQLFIGLAREGFISWPEAEAAASTGAIPAAIDAVFSALPPQQASEARITWARMSVVERDHPLTALIMAGRATEAEVDAYFRAWAEI